ncbi:MAG TPA: zf-HC2 domain-containing protein [Pyrinomonadaceae bacterium]|jgi:anti-sigma factor RsiW
MKGCLSEGVIQGLLDGELSASARHSAEAHLKECASCLRATFDARREKRLLSRLFAPRLFTPAPTARLWGGICGSLSYDRHNRRYGR